MDKKYELEGDWNLKIKYNFEAQLARQRLMEITEILNDKEVVTTDETVMKYVKSTTS